jgi:DNA-binding beta-propeller fold protein YncE
VHGHFALAGGSVWVLNADGVHQVTPATGTVARTIVPEGRMCDDVKDIAVGFDALWAACKHGSVNRVDLATGKLTAIPTETGSHTFLVSDDAVWVTNYEAGSTSRIDPATNAVQSIHGVGSGIGITEGGGFVWAATTSEFVALDSEGEVKRRLAVPEAQFWYDLIWTEQGIWGSTAGSSVYLIKVP